VTRLKRKLILVRLEIVLILTRCVVCAERTKARKSFWTHPMELLGNGGHVKSCVGRFGDRIGVAASLVHGLR
jgi:hypothetical protein